MMPPPVFDVRQLCHFSPVLLAHESHHPGTTAFNCIFETQQVAGGSIYGTSIGKQCASLSCLIWPSAAPCGKAGAEGGVCLLQQACPKGS